jgi:hypothetical protein
MGRRLALAAAVALAVTVVGQSLLGPQWDLEAWLAMGHAFREGRDPYVTVNHLPFIYPPIAVPLLAPLSLMPDRVAAWVWMALKLAALAGLVAIWRNFIELRGTALEIVYFIFAFGSALTIDLASGNPCTFEQLGLWLALFALLHGRIFWFCVAVVATAQVKISPALMLGALLVVPERPRWGAFAASSAAFLASLGLQRLLAPEWFAIFAFRAGSVDERGPSNPALLSLFRDLFPEAGLALALWAAAVLVVVFLSLRTLRRTKADMRLRIMLAALTYALIAPRFKDYSYELLLPVGLHVVQRVPLAALICFPVGRGVKIVSVIGRYLERYYPLACALALFGLLLDELGGTPAKTKTQT